MFGYIVQLGQATNTYRGYRAATADMEVGEGEQFIESLDGWTQEILPQPPSPQSVLATLEAWVATQPVPWVFKWASMITLLKDTFTWWGAEGNPTNRQRVIDVVSALYGVEGVDPNIVAFILQQVNMVDE
jgi:hypothetical protein